MIEPQLPKAIRLSDYIDERPWSRAEKFVLALGGLAFTCDGLANLILGIATPAIIADWHVTRAMLAPVAAVGLLGVAIGSILGGAVGDRIGRRWGLILSVALFSAFTFASGGASGVDMMKVLRFFAGLGIGAAIPNCAALLTETAPRSRRALIIALAMAFIPVGGMLAGLIGATMIEHFGWRSMFFASGTLCAVTAILFVFFLPESPNFLIRKPGGQRDLEAVIRRLTGPIPAGTQFYEERPTKAEAHFSGLLAGHVRRTSLGIWLGFFCCLLASYTVFSWLPSLLHANGFSLGQSSATLVAFNGGSTVGGLVAGVIMHRYGSRRPTMVMAVVAGLVAVALAFVRLDPHSPLPLSLACAALGLLLAGMHNGFYTIAADTYPPVLRAFGIGATSAFGRMGAIASSFTGAVTISSGGNRLYFLVMAGVLGLSFLAVLWGRSAASTRLPG